PGRFPDRCYRVPRSWPPAESYSTRWRLEWVTMACGAGFQSCQASHRQDWNPAPHPNGTRTSEHDVAHQPARGVEGHHGGQAAGGHEGGGIPDDLLVQAVREVRGAPSAQPVPGLVRKNGTVSQSSWDRGPNGFRGRPTLRGSGGGCATWPRTPRCATCAT